MFLVSSKGCQWFMNFTFSSKSENENVYRPATSASPGNRVWDMFYFCKFISEHLLIMWPVLS